MRQVDAIIIGSGQGGVPLASALAGSGREVVVFEKSRFGGSCTNWGCTPSKAFLAAAHAAGRARAAERLGLQVHVDVNFSSVMNRVRKIRDNFTEGAEQRARSSGVEIVYEEAYFNAHGHVQGGRHKFMSPLVVIDTGSRAMAPPIPGLKGLEYLTDRNVWNLQQFPRQVLVLGGGYIGLELGQAFARLGSAVHIIDRSEHILSSESKDVGGVLKKALEADGIRFHLGKTAARVEREGDAIRLHLEGNQILKGDALLVAAGRRPNTDALNAPAAGIELDEKGFVKVDAHFKTTRPGVYAIGEAAGQPAFTHVSWEDYRRLLGIISGRKRTRDDRVLAYAVFTEPQVARAGFSLEQARSQGINAQSARLEVQHMARAIEWGHDQGFYEMVIDADSGRIIGATLVGYEVSELVHVFVDLIEAGADWKFLDRAQHIHPTYGENLPSLARLFGQ